MVQGVAYKIADWEVDPAACLVSRDGKSVHLEPKVMDLLVFLVKQPDQVLSRDELLEEVWPGVVVSDEALTNAIIKLRKAFNDSARNPRFIETLPKRGYRLIAEVQSISAPAESAELNQTRNAPTTQTASVPERPGPGNVRWLPGILVVIVAVVIGGYLLSGRIIEPAAESTPMMEEPEKPSIAVLPFMNIGNEMEDSYFSDGITDDLITDLSNLSGLFVISRNSTFQYRNRSVDIKEVARKLGVRYVLEGSVRRSGNRVRVNTQLIDGNSGGQLWAERYDGEMKDVFTLQDRMTEKIISALALKLTAREKGRVFEVDTLNPAAYDEFLRGMQLRWHIDRESYALAEQHFLRALELDPEFTRAHAALALLYVQIWQQGWHQNSGSQHAGWNRANRHLQKAMLKPDTLTHTLRSTMQLHNRRFKEAVDEARIAVSLNPSSAEGYLALAEALAFTGESLLAIQTVNKALRLDPGSPSPYLLIKGRAMFDLKRYREALEVLEQANRNNTDFHHPMIIAIASHGQLGQLEQAEHTLERLNLVLKKDRLPEFTLSTLRNRLPYANREALQHLKSGLLKGKVPEW